MRPRVNYKGLFLYLEPLVSTSSSLLGDHGAEPSDRRLPRPADPRGHGQGQRRAKGEDTPGEEALRRGLQADQHPAPSADQEVRSIK